MLLPVCLDWPKYHSLVWKESPLVNWVWGVGGVSGRWLFAGIRAGTEPLLAEPHTHWELLGLNNATDIANPHPIQ